MSDAQSLYLTIFTQIFLNFLLLFISIPLSPALYMVSLTAGDLSSNLLSLQLQNCISNASLTMSLLFCLKLPYSFKDEVQAPQLKHTLLWIHLLGLPARTLNHGKVNIWSPVNTLCIFFLLSFYLCISSLPGLLLTSCRVLLLQKAFCKYSLPSSTPSTTKPNNKDYIL